MENGTDAVKPTRSVGPEKGNHEGNTGLFACVSRACTGLYARVRLSGTAELISPVASQVLTVPWVRYSELMDDTGWHLGRSRSSVCYEGMGVSSCCAVSSFVVARCPSSTVPS